MKNMSTAKLLCTSIFFLGTAAEASISAQVSGRGAIVGEYFNEMPPRSANYQGFRVPLSLGIEARPSNHISLFGELHFSYLSDAHSSQKMLGNTEDVEERGNTGREIAQPLTQASNNKIDRVYSGAAYLQWASDYLLVRAGRMPRHWGLGLWRSSDWNPNYSSITTTDSIAATIDMSAFQVSVYWDKLSEGFGQARSDDADGFGAEVLVADDPSDVNSSGIYRKFGVAFANYEHKQSSTKLLVLDMFGQLRSGPFGIEGELLFPSGKTRSPNYSELGGNPYYCDQFRIEENVPPNTNKDGEYITCESQKIETFATLWKLRYQIAGTQTLSGQASLLANEVSRLRLLPTSLRGESHTLGLWYGYVRGDEDAFDGTYGRALDTTTNKNTQLVDKSDQKITGTILNTNIRPALLMYNPQATPVKGMPGAAVTNTTFLRGEYVYESPTFGTLTPAIVYGRLNTTNSDQDGYGANANLGVEVDCAYNYLRTDNVNLGVEAGLWVPGKAWESGSDGSPSTVFGMRASISTQF